jgi:hypothetical protein
MQAAATAFEQAVSYTSGGVAVFVVGMAFIAYRYLKP